MEFYSFLTRIFTCDKDIFANSLHINLYIFIWKDPILLHFWGISGSKCTKMGQRFGSHRGTLRSSLTSSSFVILVIKLPIITMFFYTSNRFLMVVKKLKKRELWSFNQAVKISVLTALTTPILLCIFIYIGSLHFEFFRKWKTTSFCIKCS